MSLSSRVGALLGLNKMTIGTKFLLPFSLVIGAISLFVFIYFPTAMERQEVEALGSLGKTVATMAAFSALPGVVFNDTRELEEALEPVFLTSQVTRVEVISHLGETLVDIPRPADQSEGMREEMNPWPTLIVRAPIIWEGEVLADVVVHLSQEEALRAVGRSRVAIGLISMAIFILGVVVLALLSRVITRPLRGIVSVADEIAGGDLSRRAEVPTKDEIGSLAESFNTMVARLQSTQEQLSKMNLELEDRVRARTEELRESEVKLRQSMKMEAVGRLAGGIAHDFNNLLTVISGHVELLTDDLTPGDSRLLDLEEIGRAATRAAELTAQLLAYGRKQVLQPRPLDPREIVNGVGNMLSRMVGEDVQVQVVGGGEAGWVHADAGQLEQVLMNLAVNARDAMPKGGTLTIGIEGTNHHGAMERWQHEVPEGEYSVLVVRDTGIGIPEENRAQIFEPFFTTKGVGEGSGLGLSTVYGIVMQSGGFIFVDSELGTGTEFRIYFPVIPTTEEQSEVDPGPSGETPLPLGDESILVVEDQGMVRNLVTTALTRAGYSVRSASNRDEALEMVKEAELEFDLLLTDIIMPEKRGDELALELLEFQPQMALLYMSGFPGEEILELAEGEVDLLRKPFGSTEVVRKVRMVLDQKLRA